MNFPPWYLSYLAQADNTLSIAYRDKVSNSSHPHSSLTGGIKPPTMPLRTFQRQMKEFFMNEDTHLVSATKAIAGRILSETFGEPVYLGEGSDLGGSNRSLVLRFPV